MSKTIIPVTKISDEDCNILFKSITEKLKIDNPRFFYPIYKKVVDDETMSPDELRCTMLDSKFKCKQILQKLVDSDDEDNYCSDDEGEDEAVDSEAVDSDKSSTKLEDEIVQDGGLQVEGIDITDSNTDFNTDNIIEVLTEQKDIDDDYEVEKDDEDENIFDDDNDDAEIEEAISNTYMATAIIERTNKLTGEKTCKEETIHIKKTALLEPLKIMKDEFVIPARIQNKELDTESIRNTMSKLNSYNNSGHVESLFLYLGNKLVESGKCPSFPYYYGCINGEDPNYHHNITDEYEMVSRTKWFRDRVETDFDLLIIENDFHNEEQDLEKQDLGNPARKLPKQDLGKQDLGNPARKLPKQDFEDSEDDSNSEDNSEDNSEENSEEDSEEDSDICSEKDFFKKKSESEAVDVVNAIDVVDAVNAIDISELDLTNNIVNSNPLEFIKDMDLEDLDINENDSSDALLEEQLDELDELDDKEENDTKLQDGGNGGNGGDGGDNNKKNIDIDVDNNIDIDNNIKINCIDDSNSFIEELSDVDKDNLSIGDFENDDNNMYYVKCDKMPVSLSLMEKLDATLDDVLDEEYNMSETEWFSVFFQVAFGLAVAQKYFSFVHNDLHSSNVMFKITPLKFLYYQIGNNFYKIPTYGKVTKIIDFARGTFKFGDRWVFSDQFKEDNDAHGQYDYPVDGTLKNCEHKPNPSFDLVRLGTTVIQRLDEQPKVREFVEQITLDDFNSSLCYDEDTFQLYIDIAHNCHNAIPIQVLNNPVFDKFKINKQKINKGQYVFKY